MTVVVDASVAATWYFGVGAEAQSDLVLASDERLIAPDLLIPEFTNTIWKAVAFGNLPITTAVEAIADIERTIDEFVPSLEMKDRAFAIALELRHPAYDCFYLALAEQRSCQLITADNRLMQRCIGTRFAKLARAL